MFHSISEEDAGLTRRDVVLKTINFEGPDRVPLLYFNADQDDSDIVLVDVVDHFGGPEKNRSEWGFIWERLDDTMGQPVTPLIETLQDLASLKAPDAGSRFRTEVFPAIRSLYGADRYYIASLVLSGFTVIAAIRGFSESLADMCEDPDGFNELAEMVFGFEEEVIRGLKGAGYDAVGFFDDWGTQSGMIIDPDLWRRVIKPRYKRQFDLVHANGMHVYFHSCGYIYDIIPDFIEIGVDLLNISQPNLYDLVSLGGDFRGKICFVCPVSYQTTSISGTTEEIYADVKLLVDNLSTKSGGLVGYIEEYSSLGMSEANYSACIEAFTLMGKNR